MEIFEPRSWRSSSRPRRVSSTPLKRTLPLLIAPFLPMCCMMAIATVDLPQPDSPTSPTLSPRSTVREKSMTAGISPARVEYETFRSLISRTGACSSNRMGMVARSFSPSPSIPERDLAQPVGQQVEAQNQGGDRDTRKDRHVRERHRHRAALVDHPAPVRIGGREAEPKEAEDPDGDGDVAEAQAGVDDDRPAGVGQDLDEHDAPWAVAARLLRGDVFAATEIEGQPAHDAHDT